MILAALTLGAVAGTGIWLVLRGLSPPAVPLSVALSDLQRPRWAEPLASAGWERATRRRVAKLAATIGCSPATAHRLVLIERSQERHALDKLIYATLGVSLPLAGFGIMVLGGVAVTPALPVVLAGLVGAAGFCLPDALVRGEAADYRRDFSTQLALFLDLVVVLLAGGRGVEGALAAAAQMGDGAGFVRIRASLLRAQLLRQSPWRALDALAVEVQVPALAELAASVTLAGESGARVRESLAAKAQSIRARLLADAEAEAQRRSETMTLPVVLMLTGFVVLIGFPALHALMTL